MNAACILKRVACVTLFLYTIEGSKLTLMQDEIEYR